MEIKRYVPEITTIGLAEAAAAVVTVKAAIEGSPMPVKETMVLFLAYTYVGIPASIVIYAIRHLNIAREEKGFRVTLRE